MVAVDAVVVCLRLGESQPVRFLNQPAPSPSSPVVPIWIWLVRTQPLPPPSSRTRAQRFDSPVTSTVVPCAIRVTTDELGEAEVWSVVSSVTTAGSSRSAADAGSVTSAHATSEIESTTHRRPALMMRSSRDLI